MKILKLFRSEPAAAKTPLRFREDRVEPVLHNQPINRRARQYCKPRTGTRVLVIDKAASQSAVMLEEMLRSGGYATLRAYDAASGLAMAQELRPEIIFCEVILADMHGFTVLRKIRQLLETSQIPFVLMSSSAKAAQHYASNEIDAEGFIRKPLNREAVFAALEKLLDSDGIPARSAGTKSRLSEDAFLATGIPVVPTSRAFHSIQELSAP